MRPVLALLGGTLLSFVVPAVALAHPLGNFTINHYAGIRVEPDRVLLDVVIDQAEIPAFQARQELDLDANGEVSDPELDRGRVHSCERLAADLRLAVGRAPLEPRLTAAGLEMRPGNGGLSTLRLVCAFDAALPATIEAGTRIDFADESYPGRLGWREIVVEASGVSVVAVEGELRAAGVSRRLTDYPARLLDSALADDGVALEAAPGGPRLPPFEVPDATTVEAGSTGAGTPRALDPPTVSGAVPGGVAGEIPALFQATDLTPIVLLASLVTAAALGAGHALTPGHGKTLMAAWLVGTRGTPGHAIGLGASVSLAHTLGILVLAFIVVGAQGVLNPDLVVRVAPVVAAVTIVAIGLWMLAVEVRRRAADRGHGHGHAPDDDPRHSHLPPPGSSITWRSLFVLGLAGGIVPSTNALLIVLATVAAGRPAFGIVLVVAFGLGMAAVMSGVGLVMIVGRGRLERLGGDSPFGRLRSWVPLGAALVVLAVGLVLSFQALAGPTAL
jgi:ABC-type nickel/cobalt efflux system permease component RcnA